MNTAAGGRYPRPWIDQSSNKSGPGKIPEMQACPRLPAKTRHPENLRRVVNPLRRAGQRPFSRIAPPALSNASGGKGMIPSTPFLTAKVIQPVK